MHTNMTYVHDEYWILLTNELKCVLWCKRVKYKTLTQSNQQIKAQNDFHTNNVQNDLCFFRTFKEVQTRLNSPTKLPQIYILNRVYLNSQTLEN